MANFDRRELLAAAALEYLEREQGKVPCSRYGYDTGSCAPWAVAAFLIQEEANGPADDDTETLEWLMGLVVNDHDDIAYLVREYGYELPDSLQYLTEELAEMEKDD